ncbi:MAG: hypothetical protein JXA81_00260 [Sedimentisphaerales bacterium]|nr:hypothetical protein [Sedimentisphaerales bacterium]
MTVEDITNRLKPYFSWLSSRQWEEWWLPLMTLAALVAILIILVLISRRKVLPNRTMLRHIIGIKLADLNTISHRTGRIEKSHSTNVTENSANRNRRISTTKGFKIAIKELKQRHNEIIKSRQAELLGQRETVRLAAVKEQFQHNVTDSKRDKQHPIQQISKIAAFNKQFQYENSEQGQPKRVPEESSEQDLKSNRQSQPFDIAELSEVAIIRRQKQRSGLFAEDRDISKE